MSFSYARLRRLKLSRACRPENEGDVCLLSRAYTELVSCSAELVFTQVRVKRNVWNHRDLRGFKIIFF